MGVDHSHSLSPFVTAAEYRVLHGYILYSTCACFSTSLCICACVCVLALPQQEQFPFRAL